MTSGLLETDEILQDPAPRGRREKNSPNKERRGHNRDATPEPLYRQGRVLKTAARPGSPASAPMTPARSQRSRPAAGRRQARSAAKGSNRRRNDRRGSAACSTRVAM